MTSRVASTADHEGALMRALYDEHAAALLRYTVRLTGDVRHAEDVVQETLFRAWQHPEVLGDARSPWAWLRTVARNLIIDEWRQARLRNVVASLDDSSTSEPSAPDKVNVALDRLLIADAMAQLSPEHRAVIDRAYYRGWTIAQIAADLEIAEGTVKSRLHYALRALRHTMLARGE
jgi:RNA polymerase sigma-70 factor, ECF subfamily